MYNLARKYGEVPTTRHRVLIAPKMERSIRRVLFDSYEFYKPPEKQYLCCDEAKPAKGSATPTRLTLPQPLVVRFASGTAAGGDAESDTNDEDSEERSANGATLSYEEQMRRRKELRSIVDKCELSLDYLHRKSDKTGLEEKIVHEMEVKRRGHEKLFSEVYITISFKLFCSLHFFSFVLLLFPKYEKSNRFQGTTLTFSKPSRT